MTNNPTIDGVRKLAEQACGTATDSPAYKRFIEAINPTLLLDLTAAPVVERQPVAHSMKSVAEAVDASRCYTVLTSNQCFALAQSLNNQAIRVSSPEVAALQSTIAQLQVRVAELESARGEPVAEVKTSAPGCVDWIGWPTNFPNGTKLFALSQGHSSMACNARRYEYLRERDLETIKNGGIFAGLTPENMVLNGEDLDSAIDACLDATAALNEARK